MGDNAEDDKESEVAMKICEIIGYTSVEEFLHKEGKWAYLYDFKDSITKEIDLYFQGKEETKKFQDFINNYSAAVKSTARYCCYKKYVGSELPQENYDCDRISITREIYKTLWDWQDVMKGENGKIKTAGYCDCGEILGLRMGGDTMNSFWITFSRWLTEKYSDTYCWSKKSYKIKNSKILSKTERIEAVMKDNYLRYSEAIDKFANLTHSIGNFVLVPAHFNTCRGSSNAVYDYWDYSLLYLKNHGFRTLDYFDFEKSFEKKDYKRYINTFFLWDYVDDEGTPLSLFAPYEMFKGKNTSESEDGHQKLISKGEGDVLPTGKEIENFLQNVNYAIQRRGIFMVAMLKIAINSKTKALYANKILPFIVNDKKRETEKIEIWNSFEELLERMINEDEFSAVKGTLIAAKRAIQLVGWCPRQRRLRSHQRLNPNRQSKMLLIKKAKK